MPLLRLSAPLVSLLLLAGSASVFGQDEATHTAFVGVNVVPMDEERVLADWTVVVKGDRIVEMGSVSNVQLPEKTTIIDADGRYLVPGLFDAHAHLDPEVGARPEFGEAPLYLAFGVTSVISMKGDPAYLDARSRINDGDLLAPNLYTSGPFLNEPLITTPEEARAEVERQAAMGYDLIKFHEVYRYDTEDHFMGGITYLTTDGADQPTLNAMVEAAHDAGVPALGHIPSRMGLEGSLEARLSLAHGSILLGGYFWPSETDAFRRHARVLRVGLILLFVALTMFVLERGVALVRGVPGVMSVVVAIGTLIIVAIFFTARRAIASYHWLGDEGRILSWTGAAVVVAGITILLMYNAVRAFRTERPSTLRLQVAISAIGALVVTFSALTFWVPVLYRSTPGGLDRLASNIRDAGIWVQTTLSVEDTLVLRDLPELEYLHPTKVRASEVWAERWSPERIDLVRRGIPFFESVVGALDRADVPLMLGTDAMGFPLVIPGVSVHDEMRLLEDAGLTPYRVLRTATIQPAKYLGVEDEVGTIAVGNRADLVLVEGNPFENLGTLRAPIGVMVRGRWLDHDELWENVEAIRGPEPISDVIGAVIERAGIEAAIDRYRELSKSAPDDYVFNEAELNLLGYRYLGLGDVETAIRIFELNVETYPDAANPYDSLGEAYLAAGDRERAIANYRRSLELNPGNDNARRVLGELGVETE